MLSRQPQAQITVYALHALQLQYFPRLTSTDIRKIKQTVIFCKQFDDNGTQATFNEAAAFVSARK